MKTRLSMFTQVEETSNCSSTLPEMGEKVIHTSALAALQRQKESSTAHLRG